MTGFRGDGGPALQPRFNDPMGLAVDVDGGLLIADTGNHRIRKILPNGTIVTIAGTGVAGFSGDGGGALQARLNLPSAVAIAADGSIYIADSANNRIRRMSTVATTFDISGNSVSLSVSSGGSPSLPTSIAVLSPDPGLPFSVTVNGAPWLTLSSTQGVTPQSVNLVANPANLQPDNYQASVTFTAPLAVPPVRTLIASLTVSPGEVR